MNVGRSVAQQQQWWHHGPGDFETKESFAKRAVEFRAWLAHVCEERMASHVLVVSHGLDDLPGVV